MEARPTNPCPHGKLNAGDIVRHDNGLRLLVLEEPKPSPTPHSLVLGTWAHILNLQEAIDRGLVPLEELYRDVRLEDGRLDRRLTGDWWLHGGAQTSWNVEEGSPTPLDTWNQSFGSSPCGYSWYINRRSTSDGEWGDSVDWSCELTMGDSPRDPDNKTATVDHAVLLRIMARIAADYGSLTLPDERATSLARYKLPTYNVTDRCREECRQFFADHDAADFDADTADQVLQVAVLGTVVYG